MYASVVTTDNSLDKIVLTPVERRPREGWAEAAALMHENHDDELVFGDNPDDSTYYAKGDPFEWEW
jgi:hypothetical protein